MERLVAFVKRLLDDERIRYLIVGGWNTLFGYVLFVTLLWLFGPALKPMEQSSVTWVSLLGRNYYLILGWIGWILSVAQSTATMKYFAFRTGGSLLKQIGKAYFVYLPAQGIGTVILWLVVELLRVHPAIGSLITIFITTVFSYLGHKYFTFRTPLEVGEVPPEDLVVEGTTAEEGAEGE